MEIVNLDFIVLESFSRNAGWFQSEVKLPLHLLAIIHSDINEKITVNK